jgi:hypothetical protein
LKVKNSEGPFVCGEQRDSNTAEMQLSTKFLSNSKRERWSA